MTKRYLLLFCTILWCNCLISSSYQSGILLRKGEFEAGSSITFLNDLTKETKESINNVGCFALHGGYGFGDEFNLRGRCILANGINPFVDTMVGIQFYYGEIEPKFRGGNYHTAFSIPIGYYSTGMLQFMPALTFTKIINGGIGMNFSPRVLVGMMFYERRIEGGYLGFAFDGGASFGLFDNRLVIHPEIGIQTLTFTVYTASYGFAAYFTGGNKGIRQAGDW